MLENFDKLIADAPSIPLATVTPPAEPVIHEDTQPAALPQAAGEIPQPADDPDSPEVFTWRGVRLHPFTTSRAGLFAQHRLAVGSPNLYLVIDDVDGFLADAVRILWLCSHTPKDWSSLRCDPSAFQSVIDQWADADPDFDSVAAVLLALKIYAASRPSAGSL